MTDDLRDLWTTQRVLGSTNVQALIAELTRQAAEFDRKVRNRNLREMVAGAVVLVSFGGAAIVTSDLAMRAALAFACAAVAFVMFYIRRYGAGPSEPAVTESLTSYRDAVRARYDYQIGLLRKVKYWYLLPLYLAQLGIHLVALSKAGKITWRGMLPLGIATALFGAIWWLNEVWGVRKLRRAKRELDNES